MMKTVVIGADHRGYSLREEIKKVLHEKGYHVLDTSSSRRDPEDDYSFIGLSAAEKVKDLKGMGILLCGSGVGMCVVANKVKGIRAGLCSEERQVANARRDDDMNVLCLAADYIDAERANRLVEVFLNTVFTPEERFIRRIATINKYETTPLRS